MSRQDANDRSAGRLIVDAPAGGAWNMAVDEALVATAAEKGICSLRFYEWSEPTLSLGYFQRYDERLGHADSRACPVVRRSSGGGAILHDVELTYSLAAPVAHPLAADAQRLYTLVHESLISVLANWRIAAKRFCTTAAVGTAKAVVSHDHFLCFARRTAEDVVLDQPSKPIDLRRDISKANANEPRTFEGFATQIAPNAESIKICGSAQRRRQGAIVQHGSLLLAGSPRAPELPGILEVTGVRLSAAELSKSWTKHLENALSIDFSPQALTGPELATIRQLAIERYSADSWTRRR